MVNPITTNVKQNLFDAMLHQTSFIHKANYLGVNLGRNMTNLKPK